MKNLKIRLGAWGPLGPPVGAGQGPGRGPRVL